MRISSLVSLSISPPPHPPPAVVTDEEATGPDGTIVLFTMPLWFQVCRRSFTTVWVLNSIRPSVVSIDTSSVKDVCLVFHIVCIELSLYKNERGVMMFYIICGRCLIRLSVQNRITFISRLHSFISLTSIFSIFPLLYSWMQQHCIVIFLLDPPCSPKLNGKGGVKTWLEVWPPPLHSRWEAPLFSMNWGVVQINVSCKIYIFEHSSSVCLECFCSEGRS